MVVWENTAGVEPASRGLWSSAGAMGCFCEIIFFAGVFCFEGRVF